MPLEKVTECPLCGSSSFNSFLNCKDYTTSQESFGIVRCSNCTFAITNPRPTKLTVGTYYQSNQYVSHNATATGLFESIYFLARRLTLRWKINLIRKYNQPGTILDFGCGTGDFLNVCDKKGWNCYGVEPSSIARNKASQNPKIEVREQLQDLRIKQFDIITLWHVLEHIHDLNSVLVELKNRLTKNGVLFIAVPNYLCHDALVYKEHWAGYDVPRHLWHFSKETMSKLLLKHKLKLVTTLPMKLDSAYVSLLSEKYRNPEKNSLLRVLSAIYNGISSNVRALSTNNYSSLIYVCKAGE